MPGSIGRDELVAHLNDLLAVDEGHDMCPNGLQVEGAPTVRKITVGVSACLELFEQAARRGADTVLVHHGIFWDGAPAALTGVQYRRVAALIEHELNLVAYHLPLDRHLELGNNAVAARRFGLSGVEPYGDYKGTPVGVRGRFDAPLSPAEFLSRTREIYDHPCPVHFLDGPAEIRTLGVISGGAQSEFRRAVDDGLDAYVTGEVSEWVMNLARESGTHYVAAGHYATERLGVQELGRYIERAFGVDVEFVDIPNPV